MDITLYEIPAFLTVPLALTHRFHLPAIRLASFIPVPTTNIIAVPARKTTGCKSYGSGKKFLTAIVTGENGASFFQGLIENFLAVKSPAETAGLFYSSAPLGAIIYFPFARSAGLARTSSSRSSGSISATIDETSSLPELMSRTARPIVYGLM